MKKKNRFYYIIKDEKNFNKDKGTYIKYDNNKTTKDMNIINKDKNENSSNRVFHKENIYINSKNSSEVKLFRMINAKIFWHET